MPARPIRRQPILLRRPAASFSTPASGRGSSGGKKASSRNLKRSSEILKQPHYFVNVMLSEPHRASGDGESKHLAFRPDKHKVLRLALASLSSVRPRSG